MDKYKIIFVCDEAPADSAGLKGFVKGEFYEGRSFNGLFEVNAKWGSGIESKLIGQKTFDKYFHQVVEDRLIKTPA